MPGRRVAWLILFSVACASPKAPATTPTPADPKKAAAVDNSAAAAAEQKARLAYLVSEIERLRKESHTPGAAVAIVVGDEVVLSRGFGVRDLESKEPVTADTIFAIGSSTKAMTATAIAMLVDEGKLSWDDPADKYLPELKLQVDGGKGDKATIRDLLSHRTGFPRMSVLWASGKLSRAEILAHASNAKPTQPFRKAFQYNNVQFMAAGEISARVAKTSWAELMRTRLLTPLGMKTSHPNSSAAHADKRRAAGYTYWKANGEHIAENHRILDIIGPAGSVYSNVNEMTGWLRLQIGKGMFEGKRLVSEKALAETWNKQIEIGAGTGYGLGWMVHDIGGQRVVEHGGNIDGYAAAVGFFPDAKVGFVMLSNASATALQGQMPQLVHDAMIGDAYKATGPAIDLSPYLGAYDADFGPLKGKQIVAKKKGGSLALDVPGQTVFELRPPDKDGKWYFKAAPQIAASFEGPADNKTMLRLHQGGFDFELPRAGSLFPVVVDADTAAPLLGTYRDDNDSKNTVDLVIYRGHLTIDVPGELKLRLDNPGKDGRWQVRARKEFNIRFEMKNKVPVALVWSRAGKDKRFSRVKSNAKKGKPATLATVLKLRKVATRKRALARAGLIVAKGTVKSPQAGIDGNVTMHFDAASAYRIVTDYGKAGALTAVTTATGAWTKSDFDAPEQLDGVRKAQAQAGHPLAVHGDWNDFYDTIKLAGTSEKDGTLLYLVQLTAKGLPTATVAVDSRTGDVVEVRAAAIVPHGEIPSVVRFEDFRKVGGVRIPFRTITEEHQSGASTLQISSVRTRQKRAPSTFPPKLPQ